MEFIYIYIYIIYLLNDLWDSNKVFRKDVAYDNIKSRIKTGLRPLSRRYISGITTGGFKLTPSLLKVKTGFYQSSIYTHQRCFEK